VPDQAPVSWLHLLRSSGKSPLLNNTNTAISKLSRQPAVAGSMPTNTACLDHLGIIKSLSFQEILYQYRMK
jgi:hypothetical protein